MLNKKQIKIIEDILLKKYDRAVCERCGNVQTHRVIYCSSCGVKFCNYPENLLIAIRVAYNRENSSIKISYLRIDFLAAIYKRYLIKHQINKKDFIDYVTNRVKE